MTVYRNIMHILTTVKAAKETNLYRYCLDLPEKEFGSLGHKNYYVFQVIRTCLRTTKGFRFLYVKFN